MLYSKNELPASKATRGDSSAYLGALCIICLMANSGNRKNPIHVGAYLKNAVGWAGSVTRLSPGMTATVGAGQNDFLGNGL